jgi:hypothetical protein
MHDQCVITNLSGVSLISSSRVTPPKTSSPSVLWL